MIKAYKGKNSKIHKSVFLAETATIIGDVSIGEKSSVWYGVVLRGDENGIIIGKNTNIQDNSVLHGQYGTRIGDNVTLGHGAIAHGCIINSNCIIGMGAIVLSRAEVGENCIIGAGAVVKEGDKIPAGSLAVGIPAKVVRKLSDKDIQAIKNNAKGYRELAESYM